MIKKLILGATIGNCVHTVGLMKFLDHANNADYKTIFLGVKIPLNRLVSEILEKNPDIVALSYRMTPEVAERLFSDLKEKIASNNLSGVIFVFGGTESVSKIARKSGVFSNILNTYDEVISFLSGNEKKEKEIYPQNLVDRIFSISPHPLIRHHFGMPTMKDTIKGIKKIALSKTVDIISIGPDQNAQEFFFEPEKMQDSLSGGGGVPIRSREDLIRLYDASRFGNYPLLRIYSGTNHLLEWAKMSVETIDNCFGAIPLFWYSQLDGRSDRTLKDAIIENQHVIRWYAENNIPVEINDSHQWAFRYCGDAIEVADAYLCAINAKKLGVKHYIQQYMFNNPPGISPRMDLAKMLAKIELVESIHDKGFIPYRMVRAGLESMPNDFDEAKGHLANSTRTAMYIKPHIIHVVAYCEGQEITSSKELIESCKIVRGVIKDSVLGLPDITSDEKIIGRKNTLIKEAEFLISTIKKIGELTNPDVLLKAVKYGIFDAEHLKDNPYAKGKIKTNIIEGARYVIDKKNRILSEQDRIKQLSNFKKNIR
jgi:hypothetical protein